MLHDITQRMVAFSHERDWLIFDTPKNLAMQVFIEACELVESIIADEDPAAISRELADVLNNSLYFAHALKLDLGAQMPSASAQQIPSHHAHQILFQCRYIQETFLWLTAEESKNLPPQKIEVIKTHLHQMLKEITGLAAILQINLHQVAIDKIARNAAKYPVEKAKGTAAKYNEL